MSGKHVAVLFAFTHLRLPAYQRSNAVTTYWCHPCIIIDPSGLLGTGNRWGEGGPRKDGRGSLRGQRFGRLGRDSMMNSCTGFIQALCVPNRES